MTITINRMTGPDCAVMDNLINTPHSNKHARTHAVLLCLWCRTTVRDNGLHYLPSEKVQINEEGHRGRQGITVRAVRRQFTAACKIMLKHA